MPDITPSTSAATDHTWMQAALEARGCSHDPHHQVGCVAVAVDGRHVISANRIPGRLHRDVPERLEWPLKGEWIAHAEFMAICGAARVGVSLARSTFYSTRFPCDACALAIIASGAMEVVSPPPDFGHPRWGESFRRSDAKFREAGVLTRRPQDRVTSPEDV